MEQSSAAVFPTPTHQAIFGDGRVIWIGTFKDGEFDVDDILDGGASEREIAGRPIDMRVPAHAIYDAGGYITRAE